MPKLLNPILPDLVSIKSLNKLTTNPIGLGELKLGLSKDEVFSKDVARSVYLVSFKVRTPEYEGLDGYNVSISTPLSDLPLSGVIRFKENFLVYLEVDLGKGAPGEARFAKIKQQITDRFGVPNRSLDEMDSRRCIYGNGSSFNLKNGKSEYGWSRKVLDNYMVDATLIDEADSLCPQSMLRDSIVENRAIVYRVQIQGLIKDLDRQGRPLF